MKHVKAIAETTAEGQKVTAVAIEFDREIPADRLSVDQFQVYQRTITHIFAQGPDYWDQRADRSRVVVLTLDPNDEAAATYKVEGHKGPPPKPEEMLKLPPKKVTRLGIHAKVRLTASLTAADGAAIPPWEDWVENDGTCQLAVDDFKLAAYKDPVSGEEIFYSLYTPKDISDELPMVVFIGDGNTCSDQQDWSLVSVSGGTVWASYAVQKEHPCYVLVPQIPKSHGSMVNDQFEANGDVDTVIRLIDSIIAENHVDPKRVYATGQSMGCMAFCEINCRRHDLFAASLLVAGQWDPQRMAETCADKNLWIVVSEGDGKAFPGMNAVAQALEEAGAPVVRSYWSAKESPAYYQAEVDRMAAIPGIHYVVLDAGTVLRPGDLPMRDHHFNTWKFVYHVGALQNWLLSQRLQ